jgi:hypothetical protein
VKRSLHLLAVAAAAALSASAAAMPGAPRMTKPARSPHRFTHSDAERLAAAEAKRQRRAARNLSNTKVKP